MWRGGFDVLAKEEVMKRPLVPLAVCVVTLALVPLLAQQPGSQGVGPGDQNP